LRAAKAWGLHPRLWRAESEDDRAVMLAIYLFESTVEARRAEHMKQVMDREDKRENAGVNDFRRLKDRLKT
jgi:hypothetical protein